MKAKPTQLDSIAIKRAALNNAQQVRYRVYQSPTEFIAVIAESALLAIRISGVKDPYKVVRDLPTTGVALEKGQISVPESSEKVPLPTARSVAESLKVVTEKTQDADEPFVELALADIHKKKLPKTSVLSRDVGINLFGVSEHAPTLSAPAPKPQISAPPADPIPTVAAPDPVVDSDSEVLSQDEVAKLLGDV